MQVEKSETISYDLVELKASELRWLKAVVQNPMGKSGRPEDEDPEDCRMRDRFWHAIHQVLKS